jgi:hypothetical protein
MASKHLIDQFVESLALASPAEAATVLRRAAAYLIEIAEDEELSAKTGRQVWRDYATRKIMEDSK